MKDALLVAGALLGFGFTVEWSIERARTHFRRRRAARVLSEHYAKRRATPRHRAGALR